MSELINTANACATMHRQLLTTASAIALIGYVSTSNIARANDADRPTVWIEVGGQMERASGGDHAYSPAFFELIDSEITSPSKVADGLPLGFGPEGKISFSPKGSDWILSAGVRFGRAISKRNPHEQVKFGPFSNVLPYNQSYQTAGGRTGFRLVCCATHHVYLTGDYSDVQSSHKENHFILDFQAGRDVGLGLFGKHGSSFISGGLRIAQFTTKLDARIKARGDTQVYDAYTLPLYAYYKSQHPQKYDATIRNRRFSLTAGSTRSFSGLGPSISWDASTDLFGRPDSSKITFDWGLNAAVLFGRQKAVTHHQSSGYYHRQYYGNSQAFNNPRVDFDRSRNVVVPNVGGMAGFSVRFPNAKVSVGYRADIFFGAMDSGWDTRQTQNRSFYGPFASVSIGLGG